MPHGRRGGGLDLFNTDSREAPMPLINVRLIENVFAPEQKQQITRDLTEAVASKASACAA
jgi:hypothetical protein